MTTATPARAVPAHHRRSDEVLDEFGVDPSIGLSDDDATRRLEAHGPNELEEAERTPAWRRFLHQFRELLVLILLAAAAISFVVSGELKTPVVVLVVVLANAVIGFVQENRAEASLEALRKMLVLEVRVRRGGELRAVSAAKIVPGDIVAVEAGDRIPADARVLTAADLEVEEAALTGESLPVPKSADPVDDADAPVADRTSMLHAQTTVTRGRAEAVVTATGMGTEIGRIADLLRSAPQERTPLQRQLDDLARSLAKLAGAIVAVVGGVGLARGDSFSEVLLTAVALAVASIPEGLPAVTAVTLAIGVSQMAKRNAIVKRLSSVETLGCTTVVCSDKTGTLTRNEMTAEAIVVGDRVLAVDGVGYEPTGEIHADDIDAAVLAEILDAAALCTDAELRQEDGRWRVIGDPTEGALVALAAKAGVPVVQRRSARPRVDEIPFDSTAKLMATLHLGEGERLRMYVKGAPDVLLARATRVVTADGTPAPIQDVARELQARHDELAADGMRVLAVAVRDIDAERWSSTTDRLGQVEDLTLLALVGIVDPPRLEVVAAIGEAHRAGIRVKMITGDHVATATSIGEAIGLERDGGVVAVAGRDLDAMDDDELAARVGEIDVFARVSPEHKMRIVAALQRNGEIVAMTGDGVNDAPALARADMGIAMGITGTEVTKEAATMVLADDNFATIISAVRRGRGIYDNIVKFVRFQLATTLGFAAVFLAAAVLDLASGKPFTAIAILWVNVIMDGPPAMALGLDPVEDDTMDRPPRARDEHILTRPRWVAIGVAALTMAAGTLAVLELAPGEALAAGSASVAGTMAFNTFVLFQFFNIMNVRHDRASVLRRTTFTNIRLWAALGTVLVLQIGATHVGPMQDLFDTTSISLGQWAICVAVASSVLVVEEIRKAAMRMRG